MSGIPVLNDDGVLIDMYCDSDVLQLPDLDLDLNVGLALEQVLPAVFVCVSGGTGRVQVSVRGVGVDVACLLSECIRWVFIGVSVEVLVFGSVCVCRCVRVLLDTALPTGPAPAGVPAVSARELGGRP